MEYTRKGMRGWLVRAVIMGAITVMHTDAAVTVTLDPEQEGVVIDGFGGFGGMDVWWGSGPFYNEAFLSLLIDSLGVTLMRTSLDPMPEDSLILYKKSLPFWRALFDKARQRGEPLDLYLTAWTAPPRYKNNSNLNGGWVATDKMGAYGEYLAREVQRYADAIGKPPVAVSPVNEPAICPGYYSMCALPSQVGDLYLGVGETYKNTPQAGTTPLSCNDQIFAFGWIAEPMVTKVQTVPSVDSVVKIISGHYSATFCEGACDFGDGRPLTLVEKNAREFKHVYNLIHDPKRPWRKAWNTEFGGVFDSWDETMVDETGNRPGGAWGLATSYFQLLQFDFTGVIYWQLCEPQTSDPKTDHYAMIRSLNNGASFVLGPRYYVTKQFSRYLRPGAVKIGCTSSDSSSVWALAYRHKEQNTTTVLLMNRSSTVQQVTISGTGLPLSLQVYQTSPDLNCKLTGTVTSGSTITLPVKSLTTVYNTPSLKAVGNIPTGSSMLAPKDNRHIYSIDGRVYRRAADHGRSAVVLTIGSRGIQKILLP